MFDDLTPAQSHTYTYKVKMQATGQGKHVRYFNMHTTRVGTMVTGK